MVELQSKNYKYTEIMLVERKVVGAKALDGKVQQFGEGYINFS